MGRQLPSLTRACRKASTCSSPACFVQSEGAGTCQSIGVGQQQVIGTSRKLKKGKLLFPYMIHAPMDSEALQTPGLDRLSLRCLQASLSHAASSWRRRSCNKVVPSTAAPYTGGGGRSSPGTSYGSWPRLVQSHEGTSAWISGEAIQTSKPQYTFTSILIPTTTKGFE